VSRQAVADARLVEQRREPPQKAGAANLGGLLFGYFLFGRARENELKWSFGEG
jgi:hypothetical protein